MIPTQIITNLTNWNYAVFEKVVRKLGWAAILAHLLFYFTLRNGGDVVGFATHLIVACLLIPFLFYPTHDWRVYHKIYLEISLAIAMPGYYTYLLLANTSLYWAVALIFVTMFYAAFTRWQATVLVYPLAVISAYGLGSYFVPAGLGQSMVVMKVQLISVLSLILVQVLKTFVETSHNQMAVLKEKTDEQNEIFSALLDISVEVSRFDDLDEIFHLLLKRFENIFPGRGFGLLVEGPRPKIIPYMAFRGISQKDSTFLLQVHPYVLGFASVGNGNDEELLSSIEGEDWQVFGGGIKSTSIKGRTIYCFKLFIKGRRLDGDERKTLEVFLESIRGMTRSRIQALELERYSNTDHLTGLFNRNYFDRVIAEWQEKARPEKPFSVIFGDINGLKRINDTYGHQAGDLLIQSCSNLLMEVVRSSDMVFRMGGDEIVILCPSTALDQVEELLNRIALAVEGLIVPCVDEVSGEVTEENAYISFGTSCSTEQGAGEAVALADKRMFDNKHQWYESGHMERYR